ncbi:MAG: hypothetical protein IPK07_32475 [Deltaproteobacteria bacterium]|nr:hypothetical protein [Deltaproteobacteria bacterium]
MRKLGEILIHEGLVTPAHVDRALLWQRDDGGRIGSLLIRLGYLEEREFLRLMAAQWRTRPVLIREQNLDPALLALVPSEAARQANAVPIAIHSDHPHRGHLRPTQRTRAARDRGAHGASGRGMARRRPRDRQHPRSVLSAGYAG